jgi:hypothetical protein
MWYNEPMKHIIQFTVTKDEGVYTCALSQIKSGRIGDANRPEWSGE